MSCILRGFYYLWNKSPRDKVLLLETLTIFSAKMIAMSTCTKGYKRGFGAFYWFGMSLSSLCCIPVTIMKLDYGLQTVLQVSSILGSNIVVCELNLNCDSNTDIKMDIHTYLPALRYCMENDGPRSRTNKRSYRIRS